MLLAQTGMTDMKGLFSLTEAELMKANEKLNDYNNFPERDGVVLPEDLYAAYKNGGAAANVRDAAPLCAGLIFGAPAGIIAGIIGGAERFLSVLWGGGQFTQIACSAATVIAGVIAALLRKFMFDDKCPKWTYGLALGCVTEAIHMELIFVTHIDDIYGALNVVDSCAVPMILLNGISVTAAVFAADLITRKKGKKKAAPLSETVSRWLLLCIVAGGALVFLTTYFFGYTFAIGEIEDQFTVNIKDVKQSIEYESDRRLINETDRASVNFELALDIISLAPDDFNDAYNSLDNFLVLCMEDTGLSEISYIDGNGIILNSPNPDIKGYDISLGEQSAQFLPVCRGEVKELVQPLMPTSHDSGKLMKYAAVALENGGCLQCGYNEAALHKDAPAFINNTAVSRHIKDHQHDNCTA